MRFLKYAHVSAGRSRAIGTYFQGVVGYVFRGAVEVWLGSGVVRVGLPKAMFAPIRDNDSVPPIPNTSA